MKRAFYVATALVFAAAVLSAQYTEERVRRANANAAAARSLARQALDAVEQLQREQGDHQVEANQKAMDAEKAELDRQVVEAQAANEQRRFDSYRRAGSAASQQYSPTVKENVPSMGNLAALYTQMVQASFERAVASTSALADPDGMQRLALDAYIQRALGEPPRRAEFADPNWPESLTHEFLIKMKIAVAPSTAPTAPQPPVKPVPDSFPVLTLTNGRELHDVELKAFNSSSVLVRHRTGIETIAYELFPPEYQAGLDLRKPKPPTAADIETANARAAAEEKRDADTRARTAESVRVSNAAARSQEIGGQSLLEKQSRAVRDEAERYFKYEYVIGSGPTRVEVSIDTPVEKPGWYGSYLVRGKAYLAFDYGRAVARFEAQTETQNGVIKAKVVRVE